MVGVLCNQGCGTKVQFINGRPYNLDGKTPHSDTCISLKFGKFWGGKYNTIPLGYIKEQIWQSYELSSAANKSRNVDEILRALQATVDNLQKTTFLIEQQEERNRKWDKEFEDYKANLIKEQKEREQEKQEKGHEWKTGDELI